MAESLREKSCRACEGDVPPLSNEQCQRRMAELAPGWQLQDGNQGLLARYGFRNYYQVIAFVNAVAYIAHQENHHPDLQVGYRDCTVRWTTHAARALTLNDFICAAKLDALATPFIEPTS